MTSDFNKNKVCFLVMKVKKDKLEKTCNKSSVYDCTVEDVENVAIVTHIRHLVVVITLP